MNTRQGSSTDVDVTTHTGEGAGGSVAGEGVADFIPRLHAARAALADADDYARLMRRQRNLLVIDAVDAGVSQRAVAKAIGVSQPRVIVLLGTDPDQD